MTSRSLMLTLLSLMIMMTAAPASAEIIHWKRMSSGYAVRDPKTGIWIRTSNPTAWARKYYPPNTVNGFGGQLQHADFQKSTSLPQQAVATATGVVRNTAYTASNLTIFDRLFGPVSRAIRTVGNNASAAR